MNNILNKLWQDRSGATAIEYGLIAALIAISILGALQGFADENERTWNKVTTAMDNVVNGNGSGNGGGSGA